MANYLPKTTLEQSHASISNKLLNSCYSLSIVEKRILLLTLAKIDSSSKLDKDSWCSMSVADYASLCNVSKKDAYDTLKAASLQLFERYFILKGLSTPKSEQRCRWVDAIEVVPEEGIVRVRWSVSILPLIAELEEKFSKLFMLDVMRINGIYASRLFDMLYQEKWHGKQGSKQVAVAELITNWSIPVSCQPFGELKRSILNPAIKELEKKELVRVEMRVGKKKGKTIDSVVFDYWFS